MIPGNGDQLQPQTNVTQNTTNSGNTQPTFAKVFANSTRPRRQDAIVIESKEGLTNDDYLDGLEELIDLNQVKSISKTSGNRVCLYLESKTLVDSLKNKNVRVKDYVLPVKPLINNNKRVVISNVHSSLPDELIVSALKNLETGHISTACPQNSSISADQFPELSKAPSGNDTNTTQSLQCLPTEPSNSMAQPNNSNINKRALSTSASEISTASADITNVPTISRNESRSKKNAAKKPRIETPEEFQTFIEEALKPAEKYFEEDLVNHSVSFKKFFNVVTKSYNDLKWFEDEEVIAIDPAELMSDIDTVYSLIQSKRMKSKLTRVKNRLSNQGSSSSRSISLSEADNESEQDDA
ncbi:hypothetical protein QAD02_003729 [Eretmocerus hayati]|uniref:Uncharacterized protein n=1 Tax=Eretmocerus hayati TaxID=131215 RepID=A0ACC2NMT6_9HYME|nr:hypothetical protein QAD02_003729 [Eretmocerus hayati]